MTSPRQMALIEPPPFAPSWPNPNGTASAALHLMLGGAEIDHQKFILVPAPTADCPGRTIARYSLPAWVCQAVGQRRQP